MPIEFVSLKCPSCAGKLDVYKDMETFSCGYCGAETFVDRRGGAISLKAQTEAIEKIQKGTDKTAAELALKRLPDELIILTSKLGKLAEELDYKQQWADIYDREKVHIDPQQFTKVVIPFFKKSVDVERMESERARSLKDLETKRLNAHIELEAIQTQYDKTKREVTEIELKTQENRRIANS